jgi:hypothetical protein
LSISAFSLAATTEAQNTYAKCIDLEQIKRTKEMTITGHYAHHPHAQKPGQSIAQCLRDRTAYAKNPEKMDGGELVSAFACEPCTVDAEFQIVRFLFRLNAPKGYSSNSTSLYGGIWNTSATANSIFKEMGCTNDGVSTCERYPGLIPTNSANCSCVKPFSFR